MGVQDLLEQVLQSHPSAHELCSACELGFASRPRGGSRLRRVGQDGGIDRIGLDLGMCDDAPLLGTCDHVDRHET